MLMHIFILILTTDVADVLAYSISHALHLIFC